MSENPPTLSDLEYQYEKYDELSETKVFTNIVDCAERHRVFPQGSPFPGKMKYKKTPYMVEIAKELSPQSDTEEVVIMKSGQSGATAGATEPLLLFKILEDPGPVLAITANDELAKTWAEDRLDPMFELSGASKKFKSTIVKNSQHGGKGSTALKKSWPGGRLDIKTYGKISQIRQISYQVVILEEEEEAANALKARGAKQGDFKDVAYARTRAFRGRRKILRVSTPLIKETSTIYKAFIAGDQRYYYVPCPKCGHMQRLKWKHLRYETNEHGIVDADNVYYECQYEHDGKKCTYKIKNEDKPKMLAKGEWRATNKEKARPKTKSYHFNALYVPPGMDTFADLAQAWVDAQGDPEKMQVFVNLSLGEPYEDHGDSPPAETLYALQGNYKRGFLPHPENEGMPLFTMIGADVQRGNKRGGEYVKGKDPRIEASLVGFGLNNRTWLIDHYVIKGEVHDHNSGAFRKFREMIEKQKFPIMPEKIFIDAGYETDTVKKFCNNSQKVFPIKGVPFISEKALFKRVDLQEYNSGLGGPLPYYELRNDPIKMRIYNRMGLRADQGTGEYPDGYMMFPSNMEHKYFEQLTNERRLVKKTEGGRTKVYFDAGGRPNEALDTYCYAMQACEVFKYEMCLFWGMEATDERIFWQRAATKFAFRLAG